MLHRVVQNYRADIIALKATGESVHHRSQKDKFYLKSVCLEKAWELYKSRAIDTKELFGRVTTLIAPTVENLEYTIMELFTGILLIDINLNV